MLAAYLLGTRDLQLKDVAVPEFDSHSIRVRIKATAICGSDLKRYRSTNAGDFSNAIIGHETAGVVVDTGKDVTQFKINDRIVVHSPMSCGKCRFCYEGMDNICPNGGNRGFAVDGGFAEYLVNREHDTYPLPDSISFDEGTQIQSFSTVLHGQRRLKPVSGKSMLIIGMGATGLLHLQLAKVSGAMPIVVVDPFPWKLELAKTLGADIAIQASEDNTTERIMDATGGGGPHSVIEAVGMPDTVALGIRTIAPGGKLLMFGSGHNPLTGFDPFLIYQKEIVIIGTRAACRRDWIDAITLLNEGRIDLKPLVTHHISLKDINKGFELMDKGTERVIRIAVSPEE